MNNFLAVDKLLYNAFSDATTRLTTVEGDVAEQGDRLTATENNVDLWEDRIITLEVANMDVQERLTTVEEIILSG